MNDTTSAAPTYDQIVAAWNAQADDYNQWDELGEDEKIEWAVECVHAAVAQGEPLAWMDDGTLRAGSEATAYRVVTDATKRGMTASLAASFITPLYARPAPRRQINHRHAQNPIGKPKNRGRNDPARS